MGNSLQIRQRLDSDLAACAAVLVEVHRLNGYPVEGVAEPEKWLVSDAMLRAWVCLLNGHVVGHVAVTEPVPGDAAADLWLREHPGSDIAVLGRLFVSPAARGHSAGAGLVATATDYAADSGRQLVLDVMEKDAAAIRLYKRLGWRCLGTTRHLVGDDQSVPARCYAAPTPRC